LSLHPGGVRFFSPPYERRGFGANDIFRVFSILPCDLDTDQSDFADKKEVTAQPPSKRLLQ
jgi:hypothetical protein